MIARIVLWNIADADATIDELDESVREETADAPGLVFEAWLADPAGERWGALSVFVSREVADEAPPRLAGELLGKPPDLFEEFDVLTTRGART